ncbi:ATP-grasp domain-containing protein [Streptomyces sp. ISL-100]|uniref:ATP-grasp domain-containing protein n=1 Tax=Streptomyces sp. ISL-100 TaxID=2819173 RepID=UPI001BEC37BF|nr:ATP-grasp domain-containing protein [Streptomyces sp. ISL-100]MBT2400079.1 ATP-grasp domain-containing protein [Streptomyces sp. ISL-100]
MSGATRTEASGTGPGRPWLAFLESNTTGTGREFCAAARARGFRPVLLTRDPGRYPYVSQDGVATRVLDTGDLSAVLDACAALVADGGLAGVVSSSEYFVSAAAHAAAKLALPAADGDAVARCRDKEAQRLALETGGVPVPAFVAVDDVEKAVRAADAIGHPVVLKPVSGSGSVGVRLCRDPDETRSWAGELLGRATDERGNPLPTRILVEAAVTGPEFSVETFDGAVVAVVAKHLGPQPYFVETGHDVPAPVPHATAAALGDTALRALSALGLGWGAAHTELRMSADGPVVIEVNPRLAGGMIPVAVRAATGVDLVDAVIARAAGQTPAPAASGAGHAAVRFVRAEKEGRIAAVDGVQAAAAAPGVVAATAGTAAGRTVRITHSFQDRLGCVVATGPDADRAVRRAEAATRLISVRLENPATPEEPRIPDTSHARTHGLDKESGANE